MRSIIHMYSVHIHAADFNNKNWKVNAFNSEKLVQIPLIKSIKYNEKNFKFFQNK